MSSDAWTLEEGEVFLTDEGPVLRCELSPPWSSTTYAVLLEVDDTLDLYNGLAEALAMGGDAP